MDSVDIETNNKNEVNEKKFVYDDQISTKEEKTVANCQEVLNGNSSPQSMDESADIAENNSLLNGNSNSDKNSDSKGDESSEDMDVDDEAPKIDNGKGSDDGLDSDAGDDKSESGDADSASDPANNLTKTGEDSSKVTVIELGDSPLKLAEILNKKSESENKDTKENISLSSELSVKTAAKDLNGTSKSVDEKGSLSLLKTDFPTRSQLKECLERKAEEEALPKQVVLAGGNSTGKIILNNLPSVSLLKQKSSNIVEDDDIVEISKVTRAKDSDIDYKKLEWEEDNIYPIARPGRFIPLGANETLTLNTCYDRLIECASKITPFLLRNPIIPKIEEYSFKKKVVEAEPMQQIQSANGKIFVSDPAYFKSSLGTFYTEIGQRLVSEWVQKDLVRSRKRKMEKEGKTEASVKSLEAMAEMYEQLKIMNSSYHFKLMQCNRCNFKTESKTILENHLQTPHIYPGTYKYSCTYCNFDSRDPSAISLHMHSFHGVTPIIEPLPLFHQCVLCIYGTDKKQRWYNHNFKCSKSFKIHVNLAPTNDYSYPARSFPPTWMHNQNFQRTFGNSKPRGGVPIGKGAITIPAMGLKAIQPNMARMAAATSQLANISFNRFPMGNSQIRSLVTANAGSQDTKFRHSSKNLSSNLTLVPLNAAVSNTQAGSSKVSPITITKNSHSAQSTKVVTQQSKSGGSQKPSITLTPVNPTSTKFGHKEATKTTINGLQSITLPYKGGKGSHTFVICEICDGYVRNLDQLRAHMQWVHKVKIHPKMIHNRPPLNCQKCQFRFFTDQGLERHLLGIHGLVTSNMQESANKGEDSGRCSACGRLFQSKLLCHIAKVHKITLKPAHLSYKCTVCGATFTLYKLFETHVYSKHTKAGSAEKNEQQQVEEPQRPGPKSSKRKLSPSDNPPPSKVKPYCPTCELDVPDIERHWDDNHQKPFSVKLCRIEQCHKCLSKFDGFVVMCTEYFDSESGEDE